MNTKDRQLLYYICSVSETKQNKTNDTKSQHLLISSIFSHSQRPYLVHSIPEPMVLRNFSDMYTSPERTGIPGV